MGAVEPPSAATKLLVLAIFVALIAYADKLAAVLKGYDGIVFWTVMAFFLAASRIGTKIVVRIAAEGGELPANDEMFKFPDPVAVSQERPPAVKQQRSESWWPSFLRFS